MNPSTQQSYTTYTHSAHNNQFVPLSFFFAHTSYLQHYLFYSPYSHSYLSVKVFCFTRPPSCQRHPPRRRGKFETLLDHVNLDVPKFQFFIRTFGAHCGAAVKHTLRSLVNPLASIHGQHSVWHQTRDPLHRLTSSSGSYDRHFTTTPKLHRGDEMMPRERVDKAKGLP